MDEGFIFFLREGKVAGESKMRVRARGAGLCARVRAVSLCAICYSFATGPLVCERAACLPLVAAAAPLPFLGTCDREHIRGDGILRAC